MMPVDQAVIRTLTPGDAFATPMLLDLQAGTFAPLTDAAPSSRADPVGCAEPPCAESSAPPSSSAGNAAAATKVTMAEE